MAATQQQILQQLGRPGWRVVGTRPATEERTVTEKNEYGDPVPVKREVPIEGQFIWVLSGPNGEPDEITVKQTQKATAGAPSPGSTDPSQPAQPDLYDVVKGPGNQPPRQTTSTVEPKGARKTQLIDMPDGSKASVDMVADGLGNWSPDTSKQPVPYIAAEGKAPPPPVASTTLRQIPQLVNGAWTWVENPNYVAPEGDKPTAVTVNTAAEYIPNPKDPSSFIKNPNYKPPTAGEQAVDTATAVTAQPAAEAALRKAQADADKAEQDLANARRLAQQAPSNQQAQQAIQQALQQQQIANQQLERALAQSAQLDPIAVQQAQATLERSKQQIQQTQQGDLYGRHEQLQQIRDLIASGDVTNYEGNLMSSALNRGTSVFDALKQMQSDKATGRATSGANLNQLASTFGSMANTGLSTIGDMNKYAAVGSDAGAGALASLMGFAMQSLDRYKLPEAPTTDYLGPMVNAAREQVAAAPAPVTPPPQGGGVTNVYIGGSGAASTPQPLTPALLPPGVAGTANDPRNMAVSGYQGAPNPNAFGSGGGNVGGLISAAAQRVPVTSDEEIYDAYGVAPNRRRGGMQVG